MTEFDAPDGRTYSEPVTAATPGQDEPGLTEHVSVRFPAGMTGAARQLAAAEGLSVSAWIRREVERETRRRESQPAPELAEPPTLALYREALERLADEDTPVLGEGLGGGPAEELHVRASYATHVLGRPACGCTECNVSLGLEPDK